MSLLFEPLTLPNGNIISNRIAKASMEENMADYNHNPSKKIFKLYENWAKGGVGLILTGNVMIDAHAMTGPAGIVLENDKYLDIFRNLSRMINSNNSKIWMQINHPGRQMPKILGQKTISASAVALQMGSSSKNFDIPRAMTEDEILEVKKRFVKTAMLAQESNFNGVQIHSAHGYLLSQFLSPLSNKRNDEWGGSIENRAKLLIDIVKEVRTNVKKDFAVSVKLNSADFQRGGFSLEDAKKVVQMLNPLGIDLIELSGGNYETPAMQGVARDGSTLAREAYFLDFAKQIKDVAQVPLMVTGGIKKKEIAEKVLQSGIAMVGIATALAINPNLPLDWKNNKNNIVPSLRINNFKNKSFRSLVHMAQVKYQLNLLSNGKKTNPNVLPIYTFIYSQIKFIVQSIKYKIWIRKISQY